MQASNSSFYPGHGSLEHVDHDSSSKIVDGELFTLWPMVMLVLLLRLLPDSEFGRFSLYELDSSRLYIVITFHTHTGSGRSLYILYRFRGQSGVSCSAIISDSLWGQVQ